MTEHTDPAGVAELTADQTRYFGDIYELRRMCSILSGQIDNALSPIRCSKDGGIWTFNLSQDWVENIQFLADEIGRRSAKIDDQRGLFDPEYRHD